MNLSRIVFILKEPSTGASKLFNLIKCIFRSVIVFLDVIVNQAESQHELKKQSLNRPLQKHDIRVVSKPVKTLQQEFPSPKSRPPIELQPNVVDKISCADCRWSYVGETGRCFETRKKRTHEECDVLRKRFQHR